MIKDGIQSMPDSMKNQKRTWSLRAFHRVTLAFSAIKEAKPAP
jgi:hypothetical protein